MKKILIVGFGDVAERLAKRYAGQAEFIGLTRRGERAAELFEAAYDEHARRIAPYYAGLGAAGA